MFTYSKHSRDIYLQNKLENMAREFRCNPTIAEKKLWQYLRNRKMDGYKFRRQHPLFQYIVDFYCHEKKLIIEVDGPIHETQQQRDHGRTIVLQDAGYTVLRFTNNQVLHDIHSVLEDIIISLSHKERD